MKSLNDLTYKPIGQCIYCGTTQDLRKEHILPFGLNGTAILPRATCGACATITGQFEQKVLRGPMWPLRVYRDLKSRTKHADAPTRYPLTILRDGQKQDIDVPLEEYPILLHFPVFEPPGYQYPDGYENGINVSGVNTVYFGLRPEEVAKRLGAQRIKIAQAQEPVAFARMIAKIAFAWAAAEGKLDLLQGAPLVLPAILGRTEDIGRWVGTITEPTQKYDGLLHRILVHEDRDTNLLFGEVHLFREVEGSGLDIDTAVKTKTLASSRGEVICPSPDPTAPFLKIGLISV